MSFPIPHQFWQHVRLTTVMHCGIAFSTPRRTRVAAFPGHTQREVYDYYALVREKDYAIHQIANFKRQIKELEDENWLENRKAWKQQLIEIETERRDRILTKMMESRAVEIVEKLMGVKI